ncbi:MAG: hypothetical protein HYV36_03320 [Lentisphaerae bacterium]|nr:hypothetical protein [Lentisphaerota bacterium]
MPACGGLARLWRACPPVEGPWPTLGQAGSTLAELGQAPTVWIQFFHTF